MVVPIGSEVDGWSVKAGLGGGGQGDTFLVSSTQGDLACLKILKDPRQRERRQRFAREAGCLKSLSLDGVPEFIATNAEDPRSQLENIPFIVTEFIPGKSLDKLRQIPHSLESVLSAASRLSVIIHGLHSAGITHRDIKPENLIARDDRIENIWLVDFGLAFSSLSLDDYSTELGQELGNRFLRLPELHAGSRTKQDPVSDVTFCVGILFYLVTGITPRQLSDGSGEMPHQRDDARQTRLHSDPTFRRLLPIFDRGFRLRIEERFGSAEDFRSSLSISAPAEVPKTLTLDAIIQAISDPGEQKMQSRRNHRNAVIINAGHAANSMAARLNSVYVRSQTGHETTGEFARTQVGFALSDDHSLSERVSFEARIIGSEIVVTADGAEIMRVNADVPEWDAFIWPTLEAPLEAALGKLHDRRGARSE